MNLPSHALTRDEITGLDVIRSFVSKQRALLQSFRSHLDPGLHGLSLRKKSPASIEALGTSWSVMVHGEGVRFKNAESRECIDVHVGLFGSDEAIDAWRLGQFARSVRTQLGDFGPILENLELKGLIRRHSTLPHHYELAYESLTT